MDQQKFEMGYSAYQAGDWMNAAALLSESKSVGEVSGRTDHLLGNAFMKLGRYDDAAQAYGNALADNSYGMKGALGTNRGRALLAAGRVQEAADSLRAATEDPTYQTPYKAYTALGSACRAMGDVRGAGIAYRNAAIDETNPDPAKALTKLGGCFMQLGRPVDAIEAFRTDWLHTIQQQLRTIFRDRQPDYSVPVSVEEKIQTAWENDEIMQSAKLMP